MARVTVVGAGLGGLSAACHLAGRGHEVTVLERSDVPGGRAGQLIGNGFRFDTGPSVLTMLPILQDTFAAAGTAMEDHLSVRRLDPAYRAVFWDGSELRVRAQRDEMADEIRRVAGPSEAAGFHRFVDWVTALYHAEFSSFIDRDVSGARDLFRSPRELARLVRLGGFGRLEPRMERFFQDERLQRLFSFQALYAGLSPMKALALYAVIAYMDCVEGVWYPDGGVHAMATGLADAATKAGAEFRYGVTVEAIDAGRRCVVTASDGVQHADAVVVNPDLPVAYRQLTEVDPPRRLRRAHYSPSCLLWMLGVPGGNLGGAEHHNIHFGRSWETAFDQLLVKGQAMSDPSRLVTAASLSDHSSAPAGQHALTVLEPVPNLQTAPYGEINEEQLTEQMLQWANAAGYCDGEATLVAQTGPAGWRRAGMAAGTPFSLDHRFTQSGPFRPGLVDRRLPGVVFVGSGTRPGVGVPMVLISGRLAAEAVQAHVQP
ncbi:MAG: phytoene desaturase family protein [Acidimicrobiales bacterium]